MRRGTSWCVAAGMAMAAGLAMGQEGPRQEGPGMLPAPARARARTSPPPVMDTSYGVQVNTNAMGQNIIGDAANEPSLVVDPTAPNRMAVGWRQFDSVSSNFRQAGRAYSVDGGRHWTNPGVLTPGTFRTDPVLETTADGRFYYYSLYGSALTTCDLFLSTDHGVNWSPSVPARGGDKNWMAIDRSAGAGRNNIYIIWSPFYSCCGLNIFARSIDGGLTFGPALPVPDFPYFGTVATGPDGEVYVAGISYNDGNNFRIAKSVDAANPATTPSFPLSRPVSLGGVLRSNTGTGPNPGGLNGQVWVAVDRSAGPTRGYVYMLATVDPPTTDPGDVMLVRSTDGGNTWSAPVRVNDDAPGPNSWQWMGTLGVAPDGRLDAVWIDTRESQQANVGRLYYSCSRDAGSTWSANVPITPAWSSFVGWPQQNKIGDYYQLVSDRVGADLIYAATFNGEQDVYFVRIGEYDCNDNGVPDSTDLAAGTLHDCNGNGIPDECEIAAGQVVICACYANCDGSSVQPVLNVNDFVCFQTKYAAGDAYANCDGSTTPPVLNVNDFICFQTRYAAGCP